jgi:hypothetical protein
MRGRVERFRPMRHGHLITRERAVLKCGCAIYVGINVANGEAATGAEACCDLHTLITDRANGLLIESTAHPTNRPLVDVCAQLLAQAEREVDL